MTIYADNHTLSYYTVMIYFKKLKNTAHSFSNPYLATVSPGKNTVLTLKKNISGGSIGYSYRYNSRKGCFNTRPDKDFVYMIPVLGGKEVFLKPMSKAGIPEIFKVKDTVLKKAYRFEIKENDTVCAARRGKVVTIYKRERPGSTDGNSKNTGYFIEVMHKDCTYAFYMDLEKSVVHEGETVLPGQVLGTVRKMYKSQDGYLYFDVHYYDISASADGKIRSENHNLSLQFDVNPKPEFLEEGKTYTAQHRFEIITREMKKREVKKYKKQLKM